MSQDRRLVPQVLPHRHMADTQPLITLQQWLVCVQLPGNAQLSSVQALPSSQLSGWPAHVSPVQKSPVVQALPSSHVPECGMCVQPILT